MKSGRIGLFFLICLICFLVNRATAQQFDEGHSSHASPSSNLLTMPFQEQSSADPMDFTAVLHKHPTPQTRRMLTELILTNPDPIQAQAGAEALSSNKSVTTLTCFMLLNQAWNSESPPIIAAYFHILSQRQKNVLAALLHSQHPAIRQMAVQALMRTYLPPVDTLESLLGDQQARWESRLAAAQVLRSHHVQPAMQHLYVIQLAILNEWHSLVLLGRSTLPYLLEFLSHPDADVRTAAIQTMSAIEDPSVIPFIVPCLADSSSDVRRAAQQALHKFKYKARAQLIEQLPQLPPPADATAAKLLQQLNYHPKQTTRIIEFYAPLQQWNELTPLAADVLAYYSNRLAQAQSDVIFDRITQQLRAFCRVSFLPPPEIIPYSHPLPLPADATQDISDEEAPPLPALRQQLSQLLLKLDSTDSFRDMLEYATEVLLLPLPLAPKPPPLASAAPQPLDVAPPSDTPILLLQRLGSTNVAISASGHLVPDGQLAAEELAQSYPDYQPLILARLTSSNPAERTHAATALSLIASRENGATLVELLSSSNETICINALHTLTLIPQEAMIPPILQRAISPSIAIRRAAVATLRANPELAQPVLLHSLQHADNPALRKVCLTLLLQYPPAVQNEAILTALQDADPHLRNTAAAAVTVPDREDLVQALIACFQTSPHQVALTARAALKKTPPAYIYPLISALNQPAIRQDMLLILQHITDQPFGADPAVWNNWRLRQLESQ